MAQTTQAAPSSGSSYLCRRIRSLRRTRRTVAAEYRGAVAANVLLLVPLLLIGIATIYTLLPELFRRRQPFSPWNEAADFDTLRVEVGVWGHTAAWLQLPGRLWLALTIALPLAASDAVVAASSANWHTADVVLVACVAAIGAVVVLWGLYVTTEPRLTARCVNIDGDDDEATTTNESTRGVGSCIEKLCLGGTKWCVAEGSNGADAVHDEAHHLYFKTLYKDASHGRSWYSGVDFAFGFLAANIGAVSSVNDPTTCDALGFALIGVLATSLLAVSALRPFSSPLMMTQSVLSTLATLTAAVFAVVPNFQDSAATAALVATGVSMAGTIVQLLVVTARHVLPKFFERFERWHRSSRNRQHKNRKATVAFVNTVLPEEELLEAPLMSVRREAAKGDVTINASAPATAAPMPPSPLRPPPSTELQRTDNPLSMGDGGASRRGQNWDDLWGEMIVNNGDDKVFPDPAMRKHDVTGITDQELCDLL